MMRWLALMFPAALLTGCISFGGGDSPATPDYAAFCQDKETECREICGMAGVQSFACKAAPREGLDYQCQCRKPGERL